MKRSLSPATQVLQILQDLEPKGFPHKGGILIGESVDLDLLYLSLKWMQESLEGEGDSKLKEVSNGGQKRAPKVFFLLGKKPPYIGTQNLTVFLVFATLSGTTAY